MTAEIVETSQQYEFSGQYRLAERGVHPSVLEAVQRVDSQLPEGSLILDLGSGPGRLSHEAQLANASFLAIDGEPNAVTQYNQSALVRESQDQAHHGDIRQLDQILSLTSVDRNKLRGAVIHRVLHVFEPHEQIDVLRQTRRALNPKSTIIITTAADDDHKAIALKEQGSYSPHSVNNCAPVMTGLPEGTTFFGVHFADEAHLRRLARRSHLKLRTQSVQRISESSGYSDARNSYILAEFQTPGRIFYTVDRILGFARRGRANRRI